MTDDQRNRIEKAISDMINDMYKTHLRKMQTEMHLCAANCCSDYSLRPSMDNVQTCVEDCAGPLLRAQDFIQHELVQFQTRFQNCVMQCNDEVRDKIPLNTQETEIYKYRYEFENCSMKCVDELIGLLPSMMRSIKTVLANGPDQLNKPN